VALFPGTISPLLTVWRKLWIERDIMASPDLLDVAAVGTAGALLRNTPVAGQSTVPLGQNLSDDLSDVNLFEGGQIVFAGCPVGQDVYAVVENTSNIITEDSAVILGLPPACADGSPYTLYDDDDLSVLQSPPDGGTLLQAAFADAYILPVYADATYESVLSFEIHLTDEELLFGQGDWNDSKGLTTSSSFWACLIVGCWEPGQDEDRDPDLCWAIPPYVTPGGETGLFGATRPRTFTIGGGESAIFMQTLADQEVCLPSTDEVHTVTHEIGHTCGAECESHVPNSIMAEGAPAGESSFAPETIKVFREQDDW
jgi:hypothetical protein